MLKNVQNPKETFIVPKKKSDVPKLNFTPLQNAVSLLQESAENFQTASKNKNLSLDQRKKLDAILLKSERFLLNSKGLPRRDWFKHQIYAPGFYTGYGVKTLPGIREAIEQRSWKEAEEQIKITAKIIENFAAEIDRAASVF
jgi:N-acetylated-alpha-linked acidic dipeptidase